MLKINGVKWSVEFVEADHPALKIDKAHYTVGCCDTILLTIFLNKNLSGYYLKKVLYHELVHAYLYSYHIVLNDTTEEVFANLIASYSDFIIQDAKMIINKKQEV